jgi:hypothetical protein
MDKFRRTFRKHVVLPVIHTKDYQQVFSNIILARDAGADGVFLINHGISYLDLLGIYEMILEKFPDFWIGLNFLDLQPLETFKMIFKKKIQVKGIWVDNAGVDETGSIQDEPERIKMLIRLNNWRGLYFGGVAFKYQREVSELEKSARIAQYYMDVVTTSGPATGVAAEIGKIRRIKSAIKDVPLAIASGITPENVHQYLNIADCFLVATGISRDFKNLDLGRLKLLIKNVRAAS